MCLLFKQCRNLIFEYLSRVSWFTSATVRLNHATDSRRSYTCIKFLVSLASKSAPVKDYLMQIPSKWQWAVNWLKKKACVLYILS